MNKKTIQRIFCGSVVFAAVLEVILLLWRFKGHFIAAAAWCVLMILVFAALGAYMYSFALVRKSPFVSKPESTETNEFQEPQWVDSATEERWMISRDGLKLHAWLEKHSHRYAVVIHGYRYRAEGMGTAALHFREKGFSILAPDARGHEKSEGSYIGMGWYERLDILDWCRLIHDEDPEAEIFLYGVSMGGATVMTTVGEELPPYVSCAVEDCGYSSMWDEFEYQLKDMFGLPAFPILYISEAIAKVRLGYGFRKTSAVEQLPKCRIPVLFIHGDKDGFVPYFMLDKVYNAASCEKEKLVIEGADHAMSCYTAPERYWTAVDGFIERHMKS